MLGKGSLGSWVGTTDLAFLPGVVSVTGVLHFSFSDVTRTRLFSCFGRLLVIGVLFPLVELCLGPAPVICPLQIAPHD